MTAYARSGGERQREPRAYLDTCLVIGLRKQDLGAEQEPLRRILYAHKGGSLELVTSPVTQNEIQKGEEGDVDEIIYLLLANVPVLDEETLVPRPVKAGSGLFGPVVVTQHDLATLRAILPDENDARHLFQAISNGVEYFVTYDKATILRHRAAIENEFSILVRLPSELVKELRL